jgi:Protein of unknown function (DUF3667)
VSDETTPLIFGDTAAAEFGRYRRPKWFRKKSRPPLTHCENCGAVLSGPYCAQCGQPAIDYRRSFGSLLLDAADAFFNLDERFLKTFWLLLTKPWRLTIDFVEGKRVRHVHPLRVYLIASVIFFLVINYLSRGAHFQTHKTGTGETAMVIAGASPGPQSGAETFARELRKEIRAANAPHPLPSSSSMPSPAAALSPAPSLGAVTAARPTPTEKNLFTELDEDKNLSPFQRWLKDRAEEKIGPAGDRGDLFLKALIQNLAPMVLCCIPLFALVLKILFIFKRRYYIDHLVFALHTHAFVFLSTIVIIGVGFLLAWKAPAPLVPITCVLLSLAVLVQLLIAIRKVYRRNWFGVLFTFGLGTFIYAILLGVAFFLTAAVTLVLP